MWPPETESDIIQAVTEASLEETTAFDAKSLPTKNVEIAKDIAAMCNDGGMIIYGISEDENKRLTQLTPFPIKGLEERISTIVQNAISEPPKIFIKTIQCVDDPSLGYIVVEIPPSERAPHMVVVKGEHRFYGRSAKGNIPLSEGDVARLYNRRKIIEANLNNLLEDDIRKAPYPPYPKFGYLFMVVHPVVSSETILNKIVEPGESLLVALNNLTKIVITKDPLHGNYYPHFNPNISRWSFTPEGVCGQIIFPGDPQTPDAPSDTLTVNIENDGTGHLFCGRAAERENDQSPLFIKVVIGNVLCWLLMLGLIYEKSDYLGMVDIGLAITGIKGSVIDPGERYTRYVRVYFDRDQYRTIKRISVKSLVNVSDLVNVVEELISPLTRAMTQDGYDGFARIREIVNNIPK